MNLVTGPPGAGKSLFLMELAATVSQGRKFPDGSLCEQGSVIYLAAEENVSSVLRPRLKAAGGNMNKVHFVDGINDRDGIVTPFHLDVFPEVLANLIDSLGDVKVLLIDTIQSHLSSATSPNCNPSVRAALLPIVKMAEKYQITIIALEHMTKAPLNTGGSPISRVQGSQAFTAVPRSVWFCLNCPDSPDQRIVQAEKRNCSAPDAKIGLRFKIQSNDGVPSISFTDYTVETSVSDLLLHSHNSTMSEEVNEIDRCVTLVREMLAAGPVPAKEVEDAMAANAIATATKRRARNTLGKELQIFQSNRKWFWSLAPDADSEEVEGDQPVGQNSDE